MVGGQARGWGLREDMANEGRSKWTGHDWGGELAELVGEVVPVREQGQCPREGWGRACKLGIKHTYLDIIRSYLIILDILLLFLRGLKSPSHLGPHQPPQT